MKSRKPILLAEDDEVDAKTVSRALKQLRVANTLVRVPDGEAALQHLQDPDTETPCLILLDINMPRMNGIEFLKAVKALPNLRRIPVVMLTASDEESDKIRTFDLGIAGYIVKPVMYDDFVDAVRTLDLYWTLSKLPG